MTASNNCANDETLYSKVSGYNFYNVLENSRAEVFDEQKQIIKHAKTGKNYYCIDFPTAYSAGINEQYWISLISEPVDFSYYVWPVDLITFEGEGGRAIPALVFPVRDFRSYKPLAPLLANDSDAKFNNPLEKSDTFGLDNSQVGILLLKLVTAWRGFERFDGQPYAYHAFNFANMFYHGINNDVKFKFSFATQKVTGIFDAHVIDPSLIEPDFADPFYYAEDRKSKMDLASDYYSMAAILFKLLIGRLPYQGQLMEGVDNTGGIAHGNWIKEYHDHPIFIFDEKDDTNRISAVDNVDLYMDRWNKLPQHIRNMFHNVFQTANAWRTAGDLIFYSPYEWQRALFDGAEDFPLVYRNYNSPTAAVEVEVKKLAKPEAKADIESTEPAEQANENDPEKIKLIQDLHTVLSEVAERKKSSENIPPQSSADRYYDVILESPPASQILAIQVLRYITGYDIKTVRQMLEYLPNPVARGISEALAKRIQAELSLVGAETRLSGNSNLDDFGQRMLEDRMEGHWRA